MASFSKDQENYIEHEVQLRVHDSKFQNLDKSIDKLDESMKNLDGKLDSSIKHLDNKFMLMFGLILGSIWLPFILSYLHITK